MEKVLIDTDVLLDFFFDREPFSEHAAQVLNLCEEKKIEGYTTPVIIANTYYLLRKTAKHEAVTNKLNQLLNIIDIVKMDRKVVVKALNSNFKNSELAILTPETYVKGKMPKANNG